MIAESVASSSEKQKARDLLSAIRILKAAEAEGRTATSDERETLRRFPGFGPLARSIFPDPLYDRIRPGWEGPAAELSYLLTPEEYASAKRTTFTAFYTSPLVMNAIFSGLRRLGVPDDARALEPGSGHGNFISAAPEGMRFTGVEIDSLSGRIARLLHPGHDIRIENFRDTRLPDGGMEAVVGNVPFAEITLDHRGRRFSLHDFFMAKAMDALAPGGVMGLVTSRYSLDKKNGEARDYLAGRADLIAAIRLPDSAFKDQGTSVVTDIVFLRKREAGEPEADPTWRTTKPVMLADGGVVTMNAWLADRPEMILGEMRLDHGMHNAETLRVRAGEDYPARLADAVGSLPEGTFSVRRVSTPASAPRDVTIPYGLGEGSFFVAPDERIMQVQLGEAVPAKYGDETLRADRGLMGKRLAAQIGLRDLARGVLRSQNDGLSAAARDAARRDLNRAYDAFVRSYGPINKTTLGKNAQGVEIRRMPNLARFRDDPDAVLVMSLEIYEEADGTAKKAPIMRQDVVGRAEPVTQVDAAEKGLLVSLNERGMVDLDLISRLYGRDEHAVVAELGDLLFHDPETERHVTRDEYLSGNVRAKLAAARASTDPAHARNVAALEAVQPEDLLPGDIDANLGAPWIPVPVIRQFAAELFDVAPAAISVTHLPKDALWGLEGDYAARGSVANTAEFGTSRINGLALLEQALNMKSPTIYDTFRDGDKEVRVVNQEATIAAREKQKRIKQRFAGWAFDDPERAEMLVRLYNDGFNNIRLRQFDGSHLTFPGMSEAFVPNPHQVDAAWRIVSDGNTLLAHVVGAGKSSCMAMAAMKLKQNGLVRKSMVTVPNHMLEQFSREFLHVYPNARILIASKEDMTRDRRKLLTAKVATGDWDAIIVTHSSFEKIGMSADFQITFLEKEIAEYEELLREAESRKDENGNRAHRNIIKAIEKRKAAFEEKLKALSAEKKKDDGLVFDDLGVDHIFGDEFHIYKNNAVATKMDRVAGIQTEGSQRAFDMYMKSRYLHERTPGRGLTGATGTPISNTMVEMYTLQRYFAPDDMRERGIEHFDAWAASFGQVVDLMEISPDGASLRPNCRFAKFVNLPELQQMFRSFADVQTADMLKLPTPALKGGKAEIVACPMSDAQREIQGELVERYERVRGGGVDPREDNALSITTDGRKLALDARLVEEAADDWLDSKVNALVANVAEIHRRTADRRGTQLIFSDIGVNPNAWGFSVYGDIRAKLERAGIPAEQIADIGDANSDAKKAALFAKVRAGTVRVLLGSTAKMGTGTNVQKRLYAVHHLDAPWKPAEIEQRDGRIMRQGNDNPEVEIFRYVTEGSFDAFMWQCLERKARFIAQVMRGDAGVRRADDIGGSELSFAEVKAIASGNPAILTLAEIEADIQRLAMLKRSHADDQYRTRRFVAELPADIERLEARAAILDADHATAVRERGDIAVGERSFTSRDKAIEAMNAVLKIEVEHAGPETRERAIGSYRGLDLSVATRRGSHPEMIVRGEGTRHLEFRTVAAGSLLNRIDTMIDKMPGEAEMAREQRRVKEGQLAAYRERVGLAFPDGAKLDRLQEIRFALEAALSGDKGDTTPLVAEYESLKGDKDTLPPVEAPAEHEQPTAVILRFPVREPIEAVEPEPCYEEPTPIIEAPRPVLAMGETPMHQGRLFDQAVKAVTARPRSFREATRRQEQARQLTLF